VKELRFVGYSDDVFGEYQTFDDQYDCCASGEPIVYEVYANTGRLLVVGQYVPDTSPSDCWMIGIQLAEEGESLPPWTMRFESEILYSHALVIEAPDDVEICCVNREEKEAAENGWA